MSTKKIPAHVKYPEIPVCGLSCVICPSYVMTTKSRCPGCKTDWRFGGPCPMLHCIVRKEGIEFCWQCPDSDSCEKWNPHREYSHQYDTFVSYYALEDNIAYQKEHGAEAFENRQAEKAKFLHELLDEFNEGRSKSYFCIAVTMLETGDIKDALEQARRESTGLDIKAKAKLMHSLLDELASAKGLTLSLRKPPPKT